MADTHLELPGSRRPAPHGAIKIREVDPHAQVEVTITLRGPALPEMGNMPAQALSQAEIEKTWGVPLETQQKVEQILRGYGIVVHTVRQGGRSLRAHGSAAAMAAAFRPNFAIYEVPGQGQLRAREGTLMVPAELDGLISGVYGLDQRRMAHRHARSATAAAVSVGLQPLTPADLQSRYDFPTGDGAGQTIAIAEFGENIGNGQVLPPAYIDGDVAAFCAAHGLPVPTVRLESVGLSPLNKQQYETIMAQAQPAIQNLLFGQTAETMMDVEIVAGLCPKADIGIYFATWGEGGWVNLLDEVTSGTGLTPVALSISYGLYEEAPDWSNGAMDSINHRLQIAAMRGITVCISSGDDGTGCGQSGKRSYVEFPASSPSVLAVGGTMLTGQAVEVVWWESPGRRTPKGGGSTGGGVSQLNTRPPWQPTGIKSLNPGAPDGRVVPDVSALAGAPLYDLVLDGRPLPDGGTSASTPLWASLIARINATMPSGKRQRFLPPLLFSPAVRGAGFRDIVSGNNASFPNPGKGYAAGPGFDAVTGLGVPSGKALAAALSKV